METMNNNEILKAIVLDRNRMATIEHVCDAVVYYRVDSEVGSFLFPVDMNNKDDVGTATFGKEMKAITLMRYIRKALENNSMMRVG